MFNFNIGTFRSLNSKQHKVTTYEVWNFNSGNYLFTTDTK